MGMGASTLGPTSSTGWSDWINLRGRFNFSLSQTPETTFGWVGAVTLERKFTTEGGSANYFIVDRFTANTQQTGFEPEDNVYYRAGITSITSATSQLQLRVSQ